MSAEKEETLDSPLASHRSMKAVEDKAKEILPNIHISLDKQKSKKRRPSKKMQIIKKDKKDGGEPEAEPEPGEGPSDAAGEPKPPPGELPQSPPGLYQPSGAVGPAFPPEKSPKDPARAVPEAADIAAAAAALKPAHGPSEPEAKAPEGKEKDAPGKKTPRGRLGRLFKGAGEPEEKGAGKKDGDAAPEEEPKPEEGKGPGQRARGLPGMGGGAPSGAPAQPAKEGDAPGEDPDKKGKKKKGKKGDADDTPEDPAAKLGDVLGAAKEKAPPAAAAVPAAAVEPEKPSEPAKSPKGKATGKSPRVPGAGIGEPSGKGPEGDEKGPLTPKKSARGLGKKLSNLKGFFVPEDRDKGKKDASPEEGAKLSPKAVPGPAPATPGVKDAPAAPGKSPNEKDVGSHALDFGPDASSSPGDKRPEGLSDEDKAAAAAPSDKAPGKSPGDDLARRARELRLPEGAPVSPSAKAPESQADEEKEAPTPKKSARGLGKKLSNLGGKIFGSDKGKKPGSSEDVEKPSATEPPAFAGPAAGKPVGSDEPTADKGTKDPSAGAAPAAALAAAAPSKDAKPEAAPSDAGKDKGPVKTRELQHRPQPQAPVPDPAGAVETAADKESPKGVLGKTLSGLGGLLRSRGGAVPPKGTEEPVRSVDRACPSTDKKPEQPCDSKAKAKPSAKGKGVVDGVPVGGPSVVTAKADKVPPVAAVSGSELGATPEMAGKGGIPNAVQNVGVGAAFGALGLAFFLFGKRDDVGDVMEPEYICDSPWPIDNDRAWMQNWLWHAE